MSAVLQSTAPPAAPVTPSPRPGGPAPWRWSHEDYHRLGDLGFFHGRRVQLIFGEIVEMSAMNWAHSSAVTGVGDAVRPAFAGVGWVQSQNPLKFLGSEPEPDVAVIPGARRDYTDLPTMALLVVEVSDTTLDYDLTTKAELYAAAGVPDYWVVDVKGNRLHVLRDPHPVAAGGHSYRSAAVLTPADTVAPLAAPQAAVRVADLLP